MKKLMVTIVALIMMTTVTACGTKSVKEPELPSMGFTRAQLEDRFKILTPFTTADAYALPAVEGKFKAFGMTVSLLGPENDIKMITIVGQPTNQTEVLGFAITSGGLIGQLDKVNANAIFAWYGDHFTHAADGQDFTKTFGDLDYNVRTQNGSYFLFITGKGVKASQIDPLMRKK